MVNQPPHPDAAVTLSDLQPADPADPVGALASALRDQGKRCVDTAINAMAQIAAERRVEHLRMVMRVDTAGHRTPRTRPSMMLAGSSVR